MKDFARTLYLLFLIGVSAYPCFGKEWRGIIPLQSTRADVIKLLGNPKQQWNNPEFFEVDIGTVKFDWIDPDCVRKYPVEPLESIKANDLVLNISITLKKPMTSKELGFPDQQTVCLSCLGSSTNGPWSNCIIWDCDGGFGYTTSKDGVTSLSYGPSYQEFKDWKKNHSTCKSGRTVDQNGAALQSLRLTVRLRCFSSSLVPSV